MLALDSCANVSVSTILKRIVREQEDVLSLNIAFLIFGSFLGDTIILAHTIIEDWKTL